jgi:hypothetical protein
MTIKNIANIVLDLFDSLIVPVMDEFTPEEWNNAIKIVLEKTKHSEEFTSLPTKLQHTILLFFKLERLRDALVDPEKGVNTLWRA